MTYAAGVDCKWRLTADRATQSMGNHQTRASCDSNAAYALGLGGETAEGLGTRWQGDRFIWDFFFVAAQFAALVIVAPVNTFTILCILLGDVLCCSYVNFDRLHLALQLDWLRGLCCLVIATLAHHVADCRELIAPHVETVVLLDLKTTLVAHRWVVRFLGWLWLLSSFALLHLNRVRRFKG